jgi:TOBE domain
VQTDGGDRLTVVQQSNGRTLARGERVGLSWRDEDAFQLPGEGK